MLSILFILYRKNTFNDMSTASTMFVAPSSVLTRSGLGAQRCRDAMTLHVSGAHWMLAIALLC